MLLFEKRYAFSPNRALTCPVKSGGSTDQSVKLIHYEFSCSGNRDWNIAKDFSFHLSLKTGMLRKASNNTEHRVVRGLRHWARSQTSLLFPILPLIWPCLAKHFCLLFPLPLCLLYLDSKLVGGKYCLSLYVCTGLSILGLQGQLQYQYIHWIIRILNCIEMPMLCLQDMHLSNHKPTEFWIKTSLTKNKKNRRQQEFSLHSNLLQSTEDIHFFAK